MTRAESTPTGDRPGDGLQLDRAFADALTDLVAEVGGRPPASATAGQQQLAAWLAARPETRDVLVAGLTRSLADPAYLRRHLRHLCRLLPRMLPYEDLIPEDRIDRLLRRGPARLGDGELAWLALSPEQLCAFRGEISDNLTPFWVEAVEAAMSQAARELGQTRLATGELVAQIRERMDEGPRRLRRGGRAGRRKRPVPLGSRGELSPKPPAGRPVLYRGYWQILANPGATLEVTAVLSPRQDGFELRFLNAPADGGESGVVELRLVTEAGLGEWIQISYGGFRFCTLGGPPLELVLQGRILAVPVEALAGIEPSFRVTLHYRPSALPDQGERRD